jgi:hypothetical protein
MGNNKNVAWMPILDDNKPEGECLVFYKNQYGYGRIVKAEFYARFTNVSSDDDYNIDYCENDDTYYVQAGWYELIDNWTEYSSVAIVEGEPTHWHPLPEFPKL